MVCMRLGITFQQFIYMGTRHRAVRFKPTIRNHRMVCMRLGITFQQCIHMGTKHRAVRFKPMISNHILPVSHSISMHMPPVSSVIERLQSCDSDIKQTLQCLRSQQAGD